jgi:hypothetical protein
LRFLIESCEEWTVTNPRSLLSWVRFNRGGIPRLWR